MKAILPFVRHSWACGRKKSMKLQILVEKYTWFTQQVCLVDYLHMIFHAPVSKFQIYFSASFMG